jgi:hypothetical protein
VEEESTFVEKGGEFDARGSRSAVRDSKVACTEQETQRSEMPQEGLSRTIVALAGGGIYVCHVLSYLKFRKNGAERGRVGKKRIARQDETPRRKSESATDA